MGLGRKEQGTKNSHSVMISVYIRIYARGYTTDQNNTDTSTRTNIRKAQVFTSCSFTGRRNGAI